MLGQHPCRGPPWKVAPGAQGGKVSRHVTVRGMLSQGLHFWHRGHFGEDRGGRRASRRLQVSLARISLRTSPHVQRC